MATAIEVGPADGRAADGMNQQFYCSTSGTYFADKQSLSEHYKSDFHRYNLKRKVAGLAPVTKEWFEQRKAALGLSSAAVESAPVTKLWIDPLTKKKFASENTYQAHVRSKKYLDLVRKSGAPAPPPIIVQKKDEEEVTQTQAAKPAGFHVVTPSGGLPTEKNKQQQSRMAVDEEEEEDASDWETASEESETTDADMADKWEEWDVKRSLFDNHMSRSFEANLEYMFKNFGFYFPDAEYLADPEGLLKYLGAKLQHGRVPLYTRGDDTNAKQFGSLHAVQRHMVDTNQCKMLYEDNEDEYAQFYKYPADEEAEAGKELMAVDGESMNAMVLGGYELMLPSSSSGSSGKILGNREFARYYRQRHRLEDDRTIVVVNSMLAKYRSLGIALHDNRSLETKKRVACKDAGELRWDSKRMMKVAMRSNNLKKLPKNCPY